MAAEGFVGAQFRDYLSVFESVDELVAALREALSWRKISLENSARPAQIRSSATQCHGVNASPSTSPATAPGFATWSSCCPTSRS